MARTSTQIVRILLIMPFFFAAMGFVLHNGSAEVHLASMARDEFSRHVRGALSFANWDQAAKAIRGEGAMFMRRLVGSPQEDSSTSGNGGGSDNGSGTGSASGGSDKGGGSSGSKTGLDAIDDKLLYSFVEKPKNGETKVTGLPDMKPNPKGPVIGISTTTSAGADQVVSWIHYHRAIGIEWFFIFADGHTMEKENAERIMAEPGVLFVPKTPQLDVVQNKSRILGEWWLAPYVGKPCNYLLSVHQNLNLEMGIKYAFRKKLDWLFHIDTDELVYPAGTRDFSIQTLLAGIAPDVDTVVFTNYEALPEADNVTKPFEEVTLVKKAYDHVIKDNYFAYYQQVAKGNPNYYLTYANGKSAARVQPGLRPNGAHRFHNYDKPPNEIQHDDAFIIHYVYNRFRDVVNRKNRCGCKPTQSDAEKCFILDFDRQAFLQASTLTRGELLAWYREHCVFSDPSVVRTLLAVGLFDRMYEVQIILRNSLAHSQSIHVDEDTATYTNSRVDSGLFLAEDEKKEEEKKEEEKKEEEKKDEEKKDEEKKGGESQDGAAPAPEGGPVPTTESDKVQSGRRRR